MDLTQIPGIGPAYSERLQQAGVADARDLAAVDDLSSLQESTGIPLARLRAFRQDARAIASAVEEEEPDLGIATEGLAHELDATAARAGETLRQAWADVRLVAEQKWHELRERADDVTARFTQKA